MKLGTLTAGLAVTSRRARGAVPPEEGLAAQVEQALATPEYKGRDASLPVSSGTSPLVSVNGMMRVPTGPGLGVTVDPKFLQTAVRVS